MELLILKTLDESPPKHGFDILDWIRECTDDALIVEDGALYPALRRMEGRGLLESQWGISPKGRRARYYGLTSKGRRELEEESLRWNRYVAAVAKLGEGRG